MFLDGHDAPYTEHRHPLTLTPNHPKHMVMSKLSNLLRKLAEKRARPKDPTPKEPRPASDLTTGAIRFEWCGWHEGIDDEE